MGSLVTPLQGEPTAVTISNIGDTIVVAPGPQARLKVYWIGMSSSQLNLGEVIVEVRLGDRIKYRWCMGNPGIFSHRDLLDGQKGEALIVNLSQAYPVHFNYTYEEVC